MASDSETWFKQWSFMAAEVKRLLRCVGCVSAEMTNNGKPTRSYTCGREASSILERLRATAPENDDEPGGI